MVLGGADAQEQKRLRDGMEQDEDCLLYTSLAAVALGDRYRALIDGDAVIEARLASRFIRCV